MTGGGRDRDGDRMTSSMIRPPAGRDAVAPGSGSPAADPPARATDRPPRLRLGALVRASGGPRYGLALVVDSLGSGLLRPFLLLYGIKVLGLGAAATGVAMSAGMVLGLVSVPFVGRWIDRGARSTVVAAAMLVRVLGVALLLAAGHAGAPPVWGFAVASLFLGVGNQCWPPAHAALVATVAAAEERDAALAAGRSLRNAGLGAGALIATVCLGGGAGALRVLAAVTALGYAVAGVLAWSVRVRAAGPAEPRRAPSGDRSRSGDRSGSGARSRAGGRAGGRGLGVLDVANLPYAFCFNVLEVALPAVLVTRLHAAPAWSAGIFVGNTAIVVAAQIAVVTRLRTRARRSTLALSGLLLAGSYLGFWAAGSLGSWAAPAGIALVSVVYTAGEILYTGSATALIAATTPPGQLGRALARFQLSSGIGLAASPAVLMALLDRGAGVLWGGLAAATLLAACAVRRWAADDSAGPAVSS